LRPSPRSCFCGVSCVHKNCSHFARARWTLSILCLQSQVRNE
jgi:hypothetical protein